MKLNRSCGSTAVVALVALSSLLVWSNSQAQNALGGKVVVNFVQGSASWSRAGGPFQPLRVNQVLLEKDTVKTDANSHVDLYLGRNNGTVQVAPNSTLAFDKLNYTETGAEIVYETQLNLTGGTIYGKVAKGANGSKYEVKTPRGVAGIRGTAYRISEDGSITVTEGTVVIVIITPSGMQTYTINAGQTFNPNLPAGQELRPATEEERRLIEEALKDIIAHGGPDIDIRVFVSPTIQPFVSPILPGE